MELPAPVLKLCQAVRQAGGRAWLVGGAVRDNLLGINSKDHDVEVHRLEVDDLRTVLKGLGSVNEIGRSFGVFKLKSGDLEIDVSIPRHDSQTGAGHKDIVVVGNPFMGLESAARRRDLTINAIAYDPLTDEYRDFFDGLRDLKRGRLQAVDARTFGEDPLRALRVVQFAARFGFSVHDDLADLCRTVDLFALPAERIWSEFEKLLLKSAVPSFGWALAHDLGILEKVLPEIASLPVEPVSVALDRAAARRDSVEGKGRTVALMLSAMLHNAGRGQIEASLDRLGIHKLYGYPVRKRLLEVIPRIPSLTSTAEDRTLRRLADETELQLAALAAFAASGHREAMQNLDRAARLGVSLESLPTLLTGSDLRKHGVDAGPRMGEIMRSVRDAQIEGELSDKPGALIWLKDHLK